MMSSSSSSSSHFFSSSSSFRAAGRPSRLLLLLLLLSVVSSPVLLLPVSAVCFYSGKWYPNEPTQAVVGRSLTCYCKGKVWSGCAENSVAKGGGGSSSSSSSSEEEEETTGSVAVTARGRRAAFKNASDFVFDLNGSTPTSRGVGGTIQPLGVSELPSLAGEGVSFALFNLDPCGINLPHSHPRATEILYVISGESLKTGFVEENGGKSIINTISSGMVTFFPRGLIHYQQNLSCKPATYLSGLNSEDPGVVTVANRMFTLPEEALEASFNLDNSTIRSIRQGIPAGPAKGRIECLKKCGW